MQVTLTGTGETFTPNKWYTFHVVKASENLPETRNLGYNVIKYRKAVNFHFQNMPSELDHETESFKFYRSWLLVVCPNGSKHHLYYQRINRGALIDTEKAEPM